MISQDERNRYHFDVGMALLESRSKEKNHDLLVILDQVNFGVPSLLHDETQRLAIAELNYEAACEMMKGSNFTSAYRLANTSVMLLPEDSWAVQYDLSLKFYILLAKAANSYRKIDEAKVRKQMQIILQMSDIIQPFFLELPAFSQKITGDTEQDS
jgi:predicted ATPase